MSCGRSGDLMMPTNSSTGHVGQTGFRVDVDYQLGITFNLLEWPSKTVRSTIALPYPDNGYGGAVVSISPQARYAAAVLYSGQGETGYELFTLAPNLHHFASFPFVCGEWDLTPMPFSPDERLVALAVEERPLWWSDPDDEDADWDTPSAGGPVQWATLFVHRIGEQSPARYPLMVDLPKGWRGPETETWPAELRFDTDNRLSVGLPWDTRFSFELPPSEQPVVVAGPRR